MKKVYIAAIVLIGAAIAILWNSNKELSTYANFASAMNGGSKVKVVGELSKDKEMYYNPEKDPNYFSFYMKDDAGVERKVVLTQAKPQDFEMSEKIVLTGKMKGEEFVASEIQLKCPSKYKDEESFIKEEQRG